MSADLMIICQEDDSSFDGGNGDAAFCIGETSVGEPHDAFSAWFDCRFNGAPGLLEQIAGLKEHRFIELTEADVDATLRTFDEQPHKDYVSRDLLEKWLREHVGKHISCERW